MRIHDAMGLLVSTANDWHPYLVNPRYCRYGNTISWREHEKLFFDEPVGPDYVNLLVEKGQYSFQCARDGGLFQMYYGFDKKGNVLTEGSLSYFSVSQSSTDLDELEETGVITPVSSSTNVTWLRLDYDPVRARGIAHSHCHLHFSAFRNSRLAVHGFPNPKQFVEFIFALCYPDIYESHRLDSNGLFNDNDVLSKVNTPRIEVDSHQLCTRVTHLRIPTV